MSWPSKVFESLYATPSKNGLTRPSKVRGNGIKMINMGELFAYDRIGPTNMELVPVNEREMENMLVEEGDLLFARQSLVLSGAGKCSIVINTDQPTTFESHIIRVRLKRDEADPYFYHYYFKSPSCGIRSIVTQGVQAGIRGSDLRQLKVSVPPIQVQKRISTLLARYDDLIENNRRRIQLLEESARLVYREWFIHLRYPGHEHAKVVDGVPAGWEKRTAFEMMEVLSGGTPKTNIPDYWDGEIPFFTPKDTTSHAYVLDTEKHLSELGLSKCNSRLYPKDTLFITARGTVGKLNMAQRSMAMNQSCYALVAQPPLTQYFLYCALESAIAQFKSRAVGAVFDAIVVDTFKSIPFVVPSAALVDSFTEAVTPIYQQVDALASQTIKLAQARDLLLPRLMSGEISA